MHEKRFLVAIATRRDALFDFIVVHSKYFFGKILKYLLVVKIFYYFINIKLRFLIKNYVCIRTHNFSNTINILHKILELNFMIFEMFPSNSMDYDYLN